MVLGDIQGPLELKQLFDLSMEKKWHTILWS